MILDIELVDLRRSYISLGMSQEEVDLVFPWRLQEQNCRVKIAGRVTMLLLAGRSCRSSISVIAGRSKLQVTTISCRIKEGLEKGPTWY